MKTRFRPFGVALAACALLVAAPATAAATVAQLRVEADGRALSPGTSYVNGTARLDTAPGECGGSGRSHTVRGPSAIGLVDYAKQTDRDLRPYFVSDKFDFGLIVCRIGDRGAFNANQAWLYKVNHRSPEVGGDQFRLTGGDEVLWYFADFESGENTGEELELRAPARVRPGQPFTVRAVAYDFNGDAKPAPGVRISGETRGITGPDGRATLVATETEGSLRLRGRRDNDIPAAPLGVCVNADLDRCPERRGETIVGTDREDVIGGTAGADSVFARGGDDRVDVRGGGRDRVSCAGGRDRVVVDRGDRVERNCERVVR